jgi:structural maintenance of chromosome 2
MPTTFPSIWRNSSLSSTMCRYFGKPGTPYDFDGVNLNETRERTRELEVHHKSLSRKVNKSVMSMIER